MFYLDSDEIWHIFGVGKDLAVIAMVDLEKCGQDGVGWLKAVLKNILGAISITVHYCTYYC